MVNKFVIVLIVPSFIDYNEYLKINQNKIENLRIY